MKMNLTIAWHSLAVAASWLSVAYFLCMSDAADCGPDIFVTDLGEEAL